MIAPRHLAIGILAATALAALVMAVAPRTPESRNAASHRPAARLARVAPPRLPAQPAPRPAPSPTPAPDRPAADQPFVVRRVLDTGGPIRYGDWFWDEKAVPAGPILITVDLEAQVLSIFRGGYEIGTAAIIYGADDHPTPLGTFPVLWKAEHHVSRTYGNAPMPYTLRLRNDGVSIHGASKVGWEWASHGCVGVPVAFARKLFGATAIGDRVVITRGQRMAVDGAATAMR